MPDRFDANGLMAIAALLLTDNDEVKSLFLQVTGEDSVCVFLWLYLSFFRFFLVSVN